MPPGQARREYYEGKAAEAAAAKAEAKAVALAEAEARRVACTNRCSSGFKLDDDGTPVEPAVKCECQQLLRVLAGERQQQ